MNSVDDGTARLLLKMKEDEIQRLRSCIAEQERRTEALAERLQYYHSIVCPEGPILGLNKERGFGVSAEASRTKDITQANLKKFPKDTRIEDLLRSAIRKNNFLEELDPNEISEIVLCMHPEKYDVNSVIIQEGSEGTHLYVIEEGRVEISQGGKKIASMTSREIFGELALLYNCMRTATVKALTSCKLWTIERKIFQSVMRAAAFSKHNKYLNFLSSVPALKDFPSETLNKIVDVFDEMNYENGEYIIRQNQPGDTFFIISKGKVRVTKESADSVEPTSFIRTLEMGSFFGELALEAEEVRSANIVADDPTGVTCLVLKRDVYKTLISRNGLFRPPIWSDVQRKTEDMSRQRQDEFAKVSLSDLKFIATIGVGGFGRVELVTIGNDTKRSFALKKIEKDKVVSGGHKEHILNEKKILLETNCDFIIKLLCTFRDKKYLYLLTEAGLGGDLWKPLQKKGSFDLNATRFYTACVTEALSHLHSRGIIYRDLKPENLVWDSTGYIKLVISYQWLADPLSRPNNIAI